jgi:hypothetical protein
MVNAIADLGNGLVLRRATPADADALVAFTADVLRNQDAAEPDERIAAWTRDLVAGRHPTFSVGDFTVVEDVRSGAIVSSLCLISQTWSFGGVSCRVGQPELVGTHPDHRGRGLVRRQFEVIHNWSAARGEHFQVIDGVPWFYRQFGYEMALELRGGASIDVAHLPPPPVVAEVYRVRPAAEEDLGFITRVAEAAAQRCLVTCVRDETVWRYELCGHSAQSMYRPELCVIETCDGRPVGFLGHLPRLVASTLWVLTFEGVTESLRVAAAPSVLHYLRTAGDGLAGGDGGEHCEQLGFWLGTDHPLYPALSDAHVVAPYAWYVRVPDLPGFLRHVAPLLEQRLMASMCAGYTGELRLSFYRDGLGLVFNRGRLTAVTQWTQPRHLLGVERGEITSAPRADVSFPGLTFVQLLFGYRSLEELEYAFPDCLVRSDAARRVVNVLFPKRPSDVWAVL